MYQKLKKYSKAIYIQQHSKRDTTKRAYHTTTLLSRKKGKVFPTPVLLIGVFSGSFLWATAMNTYSGMWRNVNLMSRMQSKF